MKRLKVLTVVGTRPEIIRLSRVIARLDESEAIEHVLVHTGQNYDYELNQIFFDDLAIRKPDYFLEAAGETATETIGNILISIEPVLLAERPDAFLVLGDTNSCLCAIPAKKHHIPIFHMEAGNRCFDQRVPEESNRKIVDHISDVNLTYSDIAREYLLAEGFPKDRVIKTGSPMLEVLSHYMPAISKSDVLDRLGVLPSGYYVVSAHREENIAQYENFAKFVAVVQNLAALHGKPVLVSTHPRTRKMINRHAVEFHPLVRLLDPMSFTDYVALQISSTAVLSDSGTISEESSILNFPGLNIREAHERPEAMEEASVIMTGMNWSRIAQALVVLSDQPRGSQRGLKLVTDYDSPNVSEKVLRILLSYTDYVRRVVWFEPPDPADRASS